MRIFTALLALLSALVVLAGSYWLVFLFDSTGSSTDQVAHLTGAFNQVESRHAQELSFEDAIVGDGLKEGDVIRTGMRSRAVVSYLAGLTLNVDPTSMVVITSPSIDEEGLAVQEVRVESGTVSGDISGGRRVVRILDAQGQVAARLISNTEGSERLRYRFRRSQDGQAEVSILSGSADVDTGGETLRVKAGQAVSLPAAGPAQVKALPPYPRSLRPGVDERITPTAAEPKVQLGWEAVPGVESYRVQVARGFGFTDLATDATVDGTTYSIAPDAAGSWFWRVASIDAEGRQGEYGFVRRFFLTEVYKAGGAPPPVVEESAPEETEEIVEEELATEEEFDLKGQVLGKGLARQAEGKGSFKPISGKVKLSAKDVLKATQATGLKLGKGAVLGAQADSQMVLARAGNKGGRRVVVVELQSGEITADLSGSSSSMASVVVESRGTRVSIDGTGDQGTSARAERLPDGLRVISERGTVRVRSGGMTEEVPAGFAVLVPSNGAPGARVAIPAPPIPRTPDNSATFMTLDSPPAVDFEWSPVPEASGYQLVISFDPDGTAPVYAQMHDKIRYANRGLRPGKYYWTVRAVSPEGVRGRPGPTYNFSILKDNKPPKVTISSPGDGLTVDTAKVTVKGQTEAGAKVKINGRELSVQDNGQFSTDVNLTPGLNQIVIEAVDPANNVTFKNLKVRREGP
ncbi:MAG: hypothetical protein P1V51_24820 [Deltaproteobacteria bacterium]|nr:hypothetical protein [Deltaproteobacteria bacterium]